jgi:CRISPR-associated protein (TIGR02584 family)
MPTPSRREVLIVTGGMTPQVVTETVHALASRELDPIVPAKIVCVVTAGVAARFGEPLAAALERLRQELVVKADWRRTATPWRSARTGLFVEFPHHEDDRPVQDIRSNKDAVRFADFASEVVLVETADQTARIHVSLAGGRKTMSFHGGAALSLFGRLHDELSHVLVHPQEFEGAPDFWFPTRADHFIDAAHPPGVPADAPRRKLNAKDARIELGLIPFLHMRDRLPPWVLKQKLAYGSYVAQAEAVNRRCQLELVTAECLVNIVGVRSFDLGNREFALYQLMAEWCRERVPGAGLEGVGQKYQGWLTPRMLKEPQRYSPNAVERYLSIYDDTFKKGTTQADKARREARINTRIIEVKPPAGLTDADLADWRKDQERKLIGKNKKYFEPIKSRLTTALQERLHVPELTDRFGAPLKPHLKGGARFGLKLTPEEISIRTG